MKLLGFIPARGGSKGLPGKNKKMMLGKPLISYTIEAAMQSNLDDIAVSSDDDDILDIARQHGVRAIKRPEDLAGDLVPTLPVIHHTIATVGGNFDGIMTLQATSPLRNGTHINEAIAKFKENGKADSLVSVVKAPHKFTTNSLMTQKGDFVAPVESGDLILRRQEKPTFWGRNGAAIYITKIDKIEDYIFGGKILPYEMNKMESIDIDDIDDWMMAEAIMMYKQQN